MNKKVVVSIGVVFALVGLVVLLRTIKSAKTVSRPLATAQAKTKGNPQAAIKIVEYTDFQCPACAKATKGLSAIWQTQGNKLSLEYQAFPLPRHKNAFRAAVYAQCAARQNKFWVFHDLLFDQQALWAEKTDAEVYFQQMAGQAGLNPAELTVCLQDASVPQEIEKEKAQGVSRGVEATPTFFVNGEMVVGGKNLSEKLDSLLGLKGQ